MFDDTNFTASTIPVPSGSQILIYSDGAYELPHPDGGLCPLKDFLQLCARLAKSPDWSLDDLIENLRHHSTTNSFEDDCTLLRINFHGSIVNSL